VKATHACVQTSYGQALNKKGTIQLSLQTWSPLKTKTESHSIAPRMETMPSEMNFTARVLHSSVTCYVMLCFVL